MTSPLGVHFRSEDAWPFLLRVGLLAECRDFLSRRASGPRVLSIFGASGSGKSFFVRELMLREAADEKGRLGVYLDTPPGGLEAAAIFEKIAGQLSSQRTASRDAPSFVDHKAVRAWLSTSRGQVAKTLVYAYAVVRDLIGLVPGVGAVVKAFLPPVAPLMSPHADSAAPLRFLTRRSRTRYTLLAIDNVQFLPQAVRDILGAELREAGPHFRLVLIERVLGGDRMNWLPAVRDAVTLDVEVQNASPEDVENLVRAVMPEREDSASLAAAIYRRSEGNLKSVWYQLRLIAARRDDQDQVAASYEDVILTLPPRDQAVLRFVVFTVGGLTIANLISLLRATDLQLQPEIVTTAIMDLSALGLLVVNGASADRVRVEHELVAQVVNETTPEDEKLELRAQAVAALSAVLTERLSAADSDILSDRLLGIASAVEMRGSPSLLSQAVRFIRAQNERERYGYLASLSRDSVCWDVLDVLPETTIRSLLDAIQKSSLFDFGLVAVARLNQLGDGHAHLAALYEGKYLVQLFRYEEAKAALDRAPESKETRAIAFNIMLNLVDDDRAAEVANQVFYDVQRKDGSEQDYVILRNSGHLFAPERARILVGASVEGFRSIGRRFGAATALNNLGIAELASGKLTSASRSLENARRELGAIESPEAYQPLVNLSAVSLLKGDLARAQRLLTAARDAAPRSLLQDAAMLDLNQLVLDMSGGDGAERDYISMSAHIAETARRTRDLRFIDVALWFAAQVAGAFSPRRVPDQALDRRINELRRNGRVPLEVFVRVQLNGRTCEVPFVLSPHWRY